MTDVSLTLSPELDAFVRAEVEGGHFANEGEVVREALMWFQQRHTSSVEKLAWLRAEIQAGLDSGPAEPMDWEALRQEIHDRVAAERTVTA